MGVLDAFNEFQKFIDADPSRVSLARARRDDFISALGGADGVKEIVKSGSLERRTQLQPIHDVDLIAVFDTDAVPEWGAPGASSGDALGRVHDDVAARLGVTKGTHAKLDRRADCRDHAVKCFVDPAGDDDGFTVDVMPALRQADGTLLIPSAESREWSTADPEYLIDQVCERQSQWSYFRPMVRVLKHWRLGVSADTRIKSLVIEILALQCLPLTMTRPQALRQFFAQAAIAANYDIVDPAGHCGVIQRDLDVPALRSALLEAADLAELACDQAVRGDTDGAQRTWQQLFGPEFPAPAKGSSSKVTPAPAPLITDSPQG